MIRFIMEMASKLTPQRDMNPTTPASMDTIENATQSEQSGFGIKMSDTPAPTPHTCQIREPP